MALVTAPFHFGLTGTRCPVRFSHPHPIIRAAQIREYLHFRVFFKAWQPLVDIKAAYLGFNQIIIPALSQIPSMIRNTIGQIEANSDSQKFFFTKYPYLLLQTIEIIGKAAAFFRVCISIQFLDLAFKYSKQNLY